MLLHLCVESRSSIFDLFNVRPTNAKMHPRGQSQAFPSSHLSPESGEWNGGGKKEGKKSSSSSSSSTHEMHLQLLRLREPIPRIHRSKEVQELLDSLEYTSNPDISALFWKKARQKETSSQCPEPPELSSRCWRIRFYRLVRRRILRLRNLRTCRRHRNC